ncbi:hypothetical protein [Tumebacillus permanentifrigoris]|uniref:Matrixin n=1 Tax=Tumebacillus permanentifrigoris TaxID=378543 RepID=A0A316DGZ3_9BACL|nr:hypothetical protein [Tumebacillus permanentifrigoris]PWK16509.1 hypothetical protein C7459_101375 [Tumebacillus permanentifrigoris]
MLRKRKMATLIILSTTMLLTTSSANAVLVDSAAFFSGNGLPDSIINNCPYYEDQTAIDWGYSWYGSETRFRYDIIENADIDFYKATSKSEARIRVYASDYGDRVGWWGHTEPHAQDGSSRTEYDAWYYVDILYNDGKMDRENFSSANRLYNTLHEWGHALSLAHQTDDAISVMTQGQGTLTEPAFLDKSNLAYMY